MKSQEDASMMQVVMDHGDYENVFACSPRYPGESENQDNADTLRRIGEIHKSERAPAAIYILASTAGCIPLLNITPFMGRVEVLGERSNEPGKFSRVGYLV